jgi:hypothetical protein
VNGKGRGQGLNYAAYRLWQMGNKNTCKTSRPRLP